MTNDAPTAPLPLPARPELTGGRRIGVLLSHGFTGSPASMRPWAESLAERGYAVEVPLPARARHDLAGDEPHPVGRLVRRGHPGVRQARRRERRRGRRRAVDGRRAWCCASPPTTRPHRRRRPRQPAVATKRKDVLALPVLKHLVPSFPGLANDIKKPGVDEHGYTGRRSRRSTLDVPGLGRIVADLPRITAPLLFLRSTEDHVVDDVVRAADHLRRSPRATSPSSRSRQLPRRHARQRRPEDLRGVRRVHRPRHRSLRTVAPPRGPTYR